jgi:two-component system chemotaxis sensor kinase CheA
MSQFYQVFFEEVAEHLEDMESRLLSLNPAAPDPDQLNAIFRAAHSIKGSSSTFGFLDMSELTHVMEALLDRIRKHEIGVTTEMVDAFLKTGDVLRTLLEAHRNGEVNSLPILEMHARLMQLAELQGAPSTESPVLVIQPVQSVVQPHNRRYQIQFANTPTAFPSKTHLDNLLAELAKIGTLERQDISSIRVVLVLSSKASEDEVRELFAYFLEPSQLSIKALSEDTTADAGTYGFFVEPEALPGASASPQEDYGFFVDEQTLPAHQEVDPGYGFFQEVEQPGAVVEPEIKVRDIVKPQRRASDRALVGENGEASVRVGVAKIDKLVNLVGELVITQAMMAETLAGVDPVGHEKMFNSLAQFERNTRDLQEAVMSVRMIPISLVFSRFPRLMRDYAAKFGKQVQLKTLGESTELDKSLIEKISDPLTHLVRNSLDHGIESPAERVAKGKSPQGTITLSAAHQGGSIVISISDDGAGLNRAKILSKAKEKGMQVNQEMSDAEVWKIIFAPGFSTAAVVTDVSGRGVGMDVVKRNIESMGGRVEIESESELGTTTTIRLPLTLAILDGLSVMVGGQVYIVPLGFISESLQPSASEIREVSGQGQVVHVRGEYVPIVALHRVFNIPTRIIHPSDGILVLLEAEGKPIALFVDELLGQHQVVIKSLETNFRKVTGIAGATIMGDGRVAMILDVVELVKGKQICL